MMTINADPVPLQVDASGTIRVAGTRLTLESLLAVCQQGMGKTPGQTPGKTPEEIAACFDGIALADVYAVLSYYLHHQAEVDAYLAEQEAASEAVWRELEADPFRERVLSQRSSGRTQAQQGMQKQRKEG